MFKPIVLLGLLLVTGIAHATTTVDVAGSYNPNGAWKNFSFAQQTGKTQAVFTLSGCQSCGGYLGFSDKAVSNYDFAATVAVKGGEVFARISGPNIAFTPSATYTFRLVLDVASDTYDAYVKVGSGAEQSLGTKLPFGKAVAQISDFGFIMWGNFTLSKITLTALSDSQPAPPTPPPPQQTSIKYHPGHYVWPAGKLVDSATNRTNHFQFFDSIGNERAIEGVQLIMQWGSLEGDTPGDYSEGFGMIDAYLAKLASLPVPKRLMIGLQDRVFGTPDPDLRKYYPGYVVDRGWVDRKAPDTTTAGGLDSTAKVWRAEVMDRLIALTNAYATRYNGHPRVEMFSLSETALLSPSGTGGYSTNAYGTQLKRWCDAAKSSWKNTQLRLVANYHGSDSQMGELIEYCTKGGGVAVGGPDPETPLPNITRSVQANRIFRASDGGTDYRGVVPWVAETQALGLGASGYSVETPAEIFNYQYNIMHANYMIWMQNTWAGGSAQRWNTGILPFIQSINGVTHTYCPSAFQNRCVTD